MQSVFIRQLPNALSFARIPLCYIGMNLFFSQQYMWVLLVLLIGWGTDFFDGRIARHFNVQSKFGRWLDHAADRLSLFCVYYILYPINPLFMLLAVPGMLNSLLQIAFSVQFQEEVKVSQCDRVWFSLSTLVFPSCVIFQLGYPLYQSDNFNYVIMGIGIALGSISILQYSKQYISRYSQGK